MALKKEYVLMDWHLQDVVAVFRDKKKALACGKEYAKFCLWNYDTKMERQDEERGYWRFANGGEVTICERYIVTSLKVFREQLGFFAP